MKPPATESHHHQKKRARVPLEVSYYGVPYNSRRRLTTIKGTAGADRRAVINSVGGGGFRGRPEVTQRQELPVHFDPEQADPAHEERKGRGREKDPEIKRWRVCSKRRELLIAQKPKMISAVAEAAKEAEDRRRKITEEGLAGSGPRAKER